MSKKEILNIPVKDKIEILEGTYIRMHDGSKKKVEDIVPTDLVYSYTTHEDTIPKNIDFCDDNLVLDWTGSVDEVESGNLTPSLVTGVVSESVDGYYVFNDNIKSTPIANFLVRRDTDFYFKRAKELQKWVSEEFEADKQYKKYIDILEQFFPDDGEDTIFTAKNQYIENKDTFYPKNSNL